MYQTSWAAGSAFTQPRPTELPTIRASELPALRASELPPTMKSMELELFSVDSQMSDNSDGSDDKEKSNDICRDYLRNVCKRGKRCRYRHPHPNEAQKMGRKQDYTFCHDFQNAGCHRANCKFIHCTREEEEYYKQAGQLPVRLQQAAILGVGTATNELPLLRGEVPICKDFLKGECKRAAKCKYRHLNSTEYQYELRRPTDTRFDTVKYENEYEKYDYEPMPTAAAVAPMTPFKRRRLEGEEIENGFLNNHLAQAQSVHIQNHGHAQPAPALTNPAAAVNHHPAPAHNHTSQPAALHPTVPPPQLSFRSIPTSTNYHLLEEENMLLRRKIEELKKQVSDLAATNEVLLEQNARFRSNKNSMNNAVSSTLVPPVVTVSQVVTPTISQAAAVARPGLPNTINVLNPTLSQLTMSANSELVVSRIAQANSELVVSRMGQGSSELVVSRINPSTLTASLGPAINPPVSITTQTMVPISMSLESIAAAAAAAVPPVAASMAPAMAPASMTSGTMGQTLGIVSGPQTSMSMAGSMLSHSSASAPLVSYPIMSHATQLPNNSMR